MEVLAWIAIGFALVQFTVSLVNLVFWQKPGKPDPDFQPQVSILIPARNEEQNIGNLLEDLRQQTYRDISILVYDDQSTDGTVKIVEAAQKSDPRIQLYRSTRLPEGWTGKNHACFSLSQQARGRYFLFLDADVRIGGNIIAQTVSSMKNRKLGLLTIFPKQMMTTRGEKLTVPVMNYVLLSLLPLVLVRVLPFPSLAAANGQFMLFDAATYKKLDPHRTNREKRVEDIAIARMFKRKKINIACLTGTNNIRCRMYPGYGEALKGLSRSVLMFFGNSAFIAVLFWLLATLGWVAVAVSLPWSFLIFYLLILWITRVFISLVSRQSIRVNSIFGYVQKLNLAVIIVMAIRARIQKQMEWKGRPVTSS